MKFSIIVKTFNRKKIILKTLKSIFDQTYKNYEILIIDDCSTDGTKNFLKKKINDKRVKYYFLKKNIGHIKASEFGLNKARGDIFCFLDSDDIWDKNFLKEHYRVYKKYKRIDCAYNNTLTIIKGKKKRIYFSDIEGKCYDKALKNLYISSQIALSFKKKTWKKLKYLDSNVAREDDDLCLRLSKNFIFKHIDEDLSYAYLGNSDQITSNALDHANSYEELFNKYKKDIYKYCTKLEISNHYYKISKKFYLCKKDNLSNKYIYKSIKFNLSLKNLILYFLLQIRKI